MTDAFKLQCMKLYLLCLYHVLIQHEEYKYYFTLCQSQNSINECENICPFFFHISIFRKKNHRAQVWKGLLLDMRLVTTASQYSLQLEKISKLSKLFWTFLLNSWNVPMKKWSIRCNKTYHSPADNRLRITL